MTNCQNAVAQKWELNISTLCLRKKFPPLNCLKYCQILTDFQFFALLESVQNLLQKPYDITHHTLGMFLHYLGKLKIQIFHRYSADMEENANKLHFECTGHSADCRWSEQEHLFIHKEDKVSGRLRELLKQKLSMLRASSTVRVCQLLCTAPLETFQTQVLTDNLGHKRPMNTRFLPRDISRTVLWVCGFSSWLKTKSLTVSTFSWVRALRGLPQPGRLSTVSVSCSLFSSLLTPRFVQRL